MRYGARVKMESIKNFQLICENENNILLQFGRSSERTFTMDFIYPLTPIQAFGISLSSIDNKLDGE
jgi:tubby-related protein 1